MKHKTWTVNIKYVLHVGDNVFRGSNTEYTIYNSYSTTFLQSQSKTSSYLTLSMKFHLKNSSRDSEKWTQCEMKAAVTCKMSFTVFFVALVHTCVSKFHQFPNNPPRGIESIYKTISRSFTWSTPLRLLFSDRTALCSNFTADTQRDKGNGALLPSHNNDHPHPLFQPMTLSPSLCLCGSEAGRFPWRITGRPMGALR